jgi:hypothetical protein
MDLHHLLLAGLPAHSGLPQTSDVSPRRRYRSFAAGKAQSPLSLENHLISTRNSAVHA